MDRFLLLIFATVPPPCPLVLLTNIWMSFFFKWRMRTNLILKRLWVKTGLSHQEESGSASKLWSSCCTLSYWIFFHNLIYDYLFGLLLIVTQSLNTSSKHCVKVVLLSQKSPVFPGCLNCNLLMKQCFLFNIVLLFWLRVFNSVAFRHDFQFFNTQRLSELYEKEVRYLMVGKMNFLMYIMYFHV